MPIQNFEPAFITLYLFKLFKLFSTCLSLISLVNMLFWDTLGRYIWPLLCNLICKQECIPVGCVPPTEVAIPGVWGLHQASPRAGTPQDQTSPHRSRHPPDQTPGSRPPRSRHPPWARHPPLTESQTPVKTLPCPTFVAGGNEILRT